MPLSVLLLGVPLEPEELLVLALPEEFDMPLVLEPLLPPEMPAEAEALPVFAALFVLEEMPGPEFTEAFETPKEPEEPAEPEPPKALGVLLALGVPRPATA